jgi:acetyltransferase-like isoleucine patch superfamily enzyme
MTTLAPLETLLNLAHPIRTTYEAFAQAAVNITTALQAQATVFKTDDTPDALTVLGSLPTHTGKLSVITRGSNNVLLLEEGVQLRDTTLELRGNAFIFIGKFAQIRGALIAAPHCAITVGDKTKMNKPCRLHTNEQTFIHLGDGCLLANVTFRTCDTHSIVSLDDNQRINPSKSIWVGNRVWLAENVNVYKGITIGDGSVIASSSTVIKDVPANCVAAGAPAKPVKSNVTWNEKLLPLS